MDPQMNCFTWQNQSSDYLEGILSESVKRDADEHLKSCENCSLRYKHYRLILTSIATQPKSPLPAPIKKAPLYAPLPKKEGPRLSLSQWEQIPWLARTLMEGTGIILFILLGISFAPKLRIFYEKGIEKSISDFKESLNVTEATHSTENTDLSLPPLQDKPVILQDQKSDELASEDDSEDEEEDVHVGKAQLWRFTLKTVSPDELRPQVVKALTDLGVSVTTPGIEGVQVPGGIEFDLVLPQRLVADIKHALQKLTPKSSEEEKEVKGSEIFSWYRVKSKRKIPDGKSQVVIWLFQPH